MNKIYLYLAFICLFSLASFGQELPDNSVKKPFLLENDGDAKVTFPRKNQRNLSPQEDLGSAPNYGFISLFKGKALSEVEKIAADADGNIYAAGEFSDTLLIEGTTITDGSRRSVFLAKFNPEGALQWIKQVTSLQGGYPIASVSDLEVHGTSVYLAGSISEGSIQINHEPKDGQMFLVSYSTDGDFNWSHTSSQHRIYAGPGAGTENLATNENSVFMAGYSSIEQLDHNGNFIQQIPVPSEIYTFQIAILDQQLILAGSFSTQEIVFGNHALVRSSTYQTAFVASYDLSQQTFTWARGSNQQQPDNASSQVTIAELEIYENELYVFGAGRERLPIEWEGSATSGRYEAFVAKFSTGGDLQWLSDIPSLMDGNTYMSASFSNTGSFAVYTEDNHVGHWFDTTGQITATIPLEKYYQDLLISDSRIYLSGAADYKFLLQEVGADLATKQWQVSDEQKGGNSRFDGLEIDNEGNLYHLARINGKTGIFDTTLDGSGLVVAKTSPRGELIWLIHFEGAGSSSYGRNIKVRPENGTVYISGFAQNGTNAQGISFVPQDGLTGFVAKITSEGKLDWMQHVPRETNGVDLDSQDNVYVSGVYDEAFTLGPISAPQTHMGGSDGFLVKLNPTGSPQWGQFYGGESTEYNTLIAIDKDDNLYYTGEFTSRSIHLPTGEVMELTETDGNILFVRLNPEGTIAWTKVLASGAYRSHAWPTGIEITPAGNPVLTGWIGKEATFGSVTLSQPYIYNHFVASFLPDGSTQWAHAIQTETFGFNYNEMDIDEKGNVYVMGDFNSSIQFTENMHATIGRGNRAAYLAKYLSDGSFAYAKLAGVDYSDKMGGIAVSSEDNLYLNGAVLGSSHFGPTPLRSSANGSFLLNLCTTPTIPATLAGPQDVTTGEASNYMLSEKGLATETLLIVSPSEAVESYSVNGNNLSINWNSEFHGEATLAVAYRNSCGTSENSDALVVKVNSPNGLEEELFGGAIKLYPNPSSSWLRLELPQQQEKATNVRVKDMSGRTIDSFTIPNGSHILELNTENLAKGIYLIQFSVPGQGSTAKRFLKN